MKRILPALLFLIVIISLVGCSSKSEIGHINTQELEQRMSQSNPDETLYIDVREPDEFQSSHIEGMRNMPLSSLNDSFSQLQKDKEIVIICRSGNRSMQAAKLLQDNGYGKVINVDGGMNDWKGKIVSP